ncbi:MAG: FG-GAP-like repeat-containing protein [Gemmataceae bacterium]
MLLQQAVDNIASQLDANLPAISAPAGTSWSQVFFNPANGQQATVVNPYVPANTLVIYVGARATGGTEAAFGGSGGYSASGSQAWYNTLAARGPGGSLLWGGSIAFDSGTDWFYGNSLSGITANQVDFLSVAEHEFGHVLGLGTSPRWTSLSSGGYFRGSSASTLYGGPVPLSPEGAHWADNIKYAGSDVALDPTITRGTRVTFTALDFAGLRDIGWTVSSAAVPTFSQQSLSVAPVPVGSSLLNLAPGADSRLIAITGATDGSAQIFTQGANGELTEAGPRFQPFPGFTGVIRSTIADFDGDRKADFAFATGSGVAGTIRIISGATGRDLVGPTTVLNGFSGGVFLAAGDVDRDGKAELAVSADFGGGPRVSVFTIQNGSLRTAADFIAFGLPDFRGGSRVAFGDINKDGAADLLVGAGIGGGPRVSVYNGTTLLSGARTHLVPDFFALDPTLRSGVYVTADDVNGDGQRRRDRQHRRQHGRPARPHRQRIHPAAKSAATSPACLLLRDLFALDEWDRGHARIATLAT